MEDNIEGSAGEENVSSGVSSQEHSVDSPVALKDESKVYSQSKPRLSSAQIMWLGVLCGFIPGGILMLRFFIVEAPHACDRWVESFDGSGCSSNTLGFTAVALVTVFLMFVGLAFGFLVSWLVTNERKNASTVSSVSASDDNSTSEAVPVQQVPNKSLLYFGIVMFLLGFVIIFFRLLYSIPDSLFVDENMSFVELLRSVIRIEFIGLVLMDVGALLYYNQLKRYPFKKYGLLVSVSIVLTFLFFVQFLLLFL